MKTIKTWLVFIFVPILSLVVLELLMALVVGGLFNSYPDSFIGVIAYFLVFAVGGAVFYKTSPSENKLIAAAIYGAIYVGSSLYLAYTNDLVHHIEGSEFLLIPSIAQILGLVYGLYAANKKHIVV